MKILDVTQSEDLWHEHRHGCITGTKIESALGASYSAAKKQWVMGGQLWEFEEGKLVSIGDAKDAQIKSAKSKQRTLLLDLVSERQSILEIDDYCSASMQRGNELEPLSVAATSKKHNVNLEVCGMLQSDTLERFKFSPDAVCIVDGVVVGGCETKSKAGKTHIEYQINNEVPSEHLLQVICPMIMDDCVKWWIFSHYDDRNMINDLFTVGIKRDDYEDFIQLARVALEEFLQEVDEAVVKMGGEYVG